MPNWDNIMRIIFSSTARPFSWHKWQQYFHFLLSKINSFSFTFAEVGKGFKLRLKGRLLKAASQDCVDTVAVFRGTVTSSLIKTFKHLFSERNYGPKKIVCSSHFWCFKLVSIASTSILLQSFCCRQNVKIPGERNQISAANQIAPDYVSKIQLTPSNLNLRQLKPKSISPRFPSNVYCNFTLDNSNLPLTRSNFCFLLAHFKTILPLITLNGVISAWQIWEKKTCTRSPKHWIYFQTTK